MEEGKVARVLDIYTRLLEGETILKGQDAKRYNVSERSIQRDIEDIQIYLEDRGRTRGTVPVLVYDRVSRSYRMIKAG